MSTDLTIVLIGKTGNGKSATGNTLLGRKAFKSERTGNAVTDACSVQSAKTASGTYYVIDTPGLFDTSSIAKRAMDVQMALKICRNPHAFLLVLNAATRVTPEDLQTITLLKMIFGLDIAQHSIVVFTHGEDFESDGEFEKFWKTTPEYLDLVRECQNRVCCIANRRGPQNANFWEHPIYKKIWQMSTNGTIKYNYEYSEQHALILQRHIETFRKDMSIMDQIRTIAEDICKEVQEERNRRNEEAKKQQEEAIRQEQELLRKQQEYIAKKEEEARLREEAAKVREAEMIKMYDKKMQQLVEKAGENHTQELQRMQKNMEDMKVSNKEKQEEAKQRLKEAKQEAEERRKRETELLEQLCESKKKERREDCTIQ